MKWLNKKLETATFAMGCFWQPDYVFSKVNGIIKKRVGYTRCNKECNNPTYEQVCSSETGCAEAIQLLFDPAIVTYDELLDMFWKNHDPTQMNRQGPDVGTQYRSAIFCHTAEQKRIARASKKKWGKKLTDSALKIVTEIVSASAFYPAEDYHQDYLQRTGRSCHISTSPFV
ncbi:MAG: peptide-methionine (S)-S-oxide reductase MsrA [Nanoarchaeota archaeon]